MKTIYKACPGSIVALHLIAFFSACLLSCSDDSIAPFILNATHTESAEETLGPESPTSSTENQGSTTSGEDADDPPSITCIPGVHTKFMEVGSGVAFDPFQICSAEQLANMKKLSDLDSLADEQHIGQYGYASAFFKLMNDIDLSIHYAGNSEFQIAEEGFSFSGHFDGNGFTVFNFKNNQVAKNKSKPSGGGLFSKVSSGKIHDLRLDHSSVDAQSKAGLLIDELNGDFKIENIFINSSEINGHYSIGGVFGEVTLASKSSSIRGIHVDGLKMKIDHFFSQSRERYGKMGGLAGFIDGTLVQDVSIKATLEFLPSNSSSFQIHENKDKFIFHEYGGIAGKSTFIDYENIHFEGSILSVGVSSEQKMEKVGGLFGGIANSHVLNSSFKNPLTIMLAQDVHELGGIAGSSESNEMERLLLSDAKISVENCKYVGGLIGNAWGTSLKRSSVEKADLKFKSVESSSGGLVGSMGNHSLIERSWVNLESNALHAERFGGIVGVCGGSIQDVYANFHVDSNESEIAGIVRFNVSCQIKNAYSAGTIKLPLNQKRWTSGLVVEGLNGSIENSWSGMEFIGPADYDLVQVSGILSLGDSILSEVYFVQPQNYNSLQCLSHYAIVQEGKIEPPNCIVKTIDVFKSSEHSVYKTWKESGVWVFEEGKLPTLKP